MSRGILSWIHLIRGSLLNFMVQRMTERNVGRTRLIGFSSVLLDITPKSRKPCGRAISVCLTASISHRRTSSNQSAHLSSVRRRMVSVGRRQVGWSYRVQSRVAGCLAAPTESKGRACICVTSGILFIFPIPKQLFRIYQIISISDIQNNYFRYPK